ncbi:MAG TPA: hypothetical protein VFP03_08300 [Jiangellaceae bacterium]|nr:hypothetical protein [Jiangellaceae bacterium]
MSSRSGPREALVGRIPGLPRTDLFSTFNTAALAFSPDGDLFISNEAQRVRIFDPANLEQIGELPTPAFQFPGSPSRLAFTSDGQALVGTSEFHQMAAAWDVPSRTLRWSRCDAPRLIMTIAPTSEGPM